MVSVLPHEFDGEAYKKSSIHQKEWGNKIISEFHFRGNERILDLGCGDGTLTANLAALVPDGFVLGIDSSHSMIETAKKLCQNNLTFKFQDINNLDYNEEFDVVYSNATLQWIKDHNRLLGNTFRCLKRNGIVRFNFAADGNCSHFITVSREAMQLPRYAMFFKSFEWPWYMPTLSEYEALAKMSKFSEIKAWSEVADRYFPNKETMIKWVKQPSLVPFLECIPPEHKKSFRDYVIEKMVTETLQADGTCFETFRRINLYGRKQ